MELSFSSSDIEMGSLSEPKSVGSLDKASMGTGNPDFGKLELEDDEVEGRILAGSWGTGILRLWGTIDFAWPFETVFRIGFDGALGIGGGMGDLTFFFLYTFGGGGGGIELRRCFFAGMSQLLGVQLVVTLLVAGSLVGVSTVSDLGIFLIPGI